MVSVSRQKPHKTIFYTDTVVEGQLNRGWMSVMQYFGEIYNLVYGHSVIVHSESFLDKDLYLVDIFGSFFPPPTSFVIIEKGISTHGKR